MNFDALWRSFLSDQQAVLPSGLAQYSGLYLAWALVLAWGVSAFGGRWSARLRWGAMAAVVLVTLVPGPSSPAYWLGLAFQSPSLTSVLLAVWRVSVCARGRPMKVAVGGSRSARVVCALGVGLGWVLLVDTLAGWPVSVYAWGFSAAAVAGVALTLVLGWTVFGGARTGQARDVVWAIPALALAIFVVTRWPTGNVWDAVLDPWLWVGLQLLLLIRGLRAWRLRGAPAIRA